MLKISGIIFCLSYIIALLSTGVSSSPVHQFSTSTWTGFFLALTILTTLATIFIPRFWRFGPTRVYWIITGVIALVAVIYYHLRLPVQGVNDISLELNNFQGNFSPIVQVKGEILTSPQLTRSDKLRFILQTTDFQPSSATTKQVTGKLYVTISQEQIPELYPSQRVTVKGKLYQPSSAQNPGQFDFKTYLLRQGIFAGFTADEIKIEQEGNFLSWGIWKLSNRITQTHQRYLKSPLGELVSSIVLGRRAVDLPYDLQDVFIKIGLAHILAASGFQVSVLLGSVLYFTRSSSPKIQLITGVTILLIYLTLTGFYPPILRATIMGVAVLVGIKSDRQVNSLNSLLLAATILLLIKPLWIWDLSFQLSFLATLGLLVTFYPIINRLDFIPPTIAALIAVPLSCSVWVLPFLAYIFNTIATYSLLVNILVTPLVTIITLGGMLSGFVGILFFQLGATIGWLLYYPTLFLINIAEFFVKLPGSSFAVGKISLAVLFLCYGIFLAIWLIPWCQQRWKLMSLFLITVIILPVIYTNFKLIQVTVLATKPEPIIIIQDQGKVTLINSGDSDTVRYTLFPFFGDNAINKLDLVIMINPNDQDLKGLDFLLNNISSELIFVTKNQSQKYNLLTLNQNISLGNQQIDLISLKPSILQLNIFGKTWLFLDGKLTKKPELNLKSDVLVWYGGNIPWNWLNSIQSKMAIAYGKTISSSMKQRLKEKNIEFYSTPEEGAIQWTPKGKFTPYQSDYAIMSD
jgi:competence protein ComEC